MEIRASPTTPTPTPSPALAPVDMPLLPLLEEVYVGVLMGFRVDVGAGVDVVVEDVVVGFGGPEVSKRLRRLGIVRSLVDLGKEEEGKERGRLTYQSRAPLRLRRSSLK
jgi:hypothetical protein